MKAFLTLFLSLLCSIISFSQGTEAITTNKDSLWHVWSEGIGTITMIKNDFCRSTRQDKCPHSSYPASASPQACAYPAHPSRFKDPK